MRLKVSKDENGRQRLEIESDRPFLTDEEEESRREFEQRIPVVTEKILSGFYHYGKKPQPQSKSQRDGQ